MASTVGHVAAALAVCAAVRPPFSVPPRYWWFAGLAGALPDIDVVGPLLGAPALRALGGHRGFTHSLVFAALLGAALTALTVRHAAAGLPDASHRRRLWLAFALATASHAGLDSLTTYGQGVALLAPFDWARLTAPWHPLGSPAAARGHGPAVRGLLLIANEALWVWLPAIAVAVAAAPARPSPRSPPARPRG